MSELRALIREVLAEELAALRAELGATPAVERVAVGTEADLTRFALEVARRAAEPDYLAALEAGRIRYAPAAAVAPPPRVVAPAPVASAPQAAVIASLPPAVPELRKTLVTERDIAALSGGARRLRLSKAARITPLAADEARRRGIRIERTLA